MYNDKIMKILELLCNIWYKIQDFLSKLFILSRTSLKVLWKMHKKYFSTEIRKKSGIFFFFQNLKLSNTNLKMLYMYFFFLSWLNLMDRILWKKMPVPLKTKEKNRITGWKNLVFFFQLVIEVFLLKNVKGQRK